MTRLRQGRVDGLTRARLAVLVSVLIRLLRRVAPPLETNTNILVNLDMEAGLEYNSYKYSLKRL